MVIALPLPLHLCWAHLLLQAARMGGHAGVVARAGARLAEHFVTVSPVRPLWEANPMDAQWLNRWADQGFCVWMSDGGG